MRRTSVNSTALRAVEYRRFAPEYRGTIPNATGFLLVTFKSGSKRAHAVGPHVAGLFAAAIARKRSVGRLYNLVVRGKCQSVKMKAN